MCVFEKKYIIRFFVGQLKFETECFSWGFKPLRAQPRVFHQTKRTELAF